MIKDLCIKKSFKKLGLKKKDVVMIHGDAGVAAQLKFKKKGKLYYFIKEILDYFSHEGTIIVPTYTYSFANTRLYDQKNSPSEVGLFSETFRKMRGVYRTKHPIFSFAVYGKFAKEVLNCDTSDSFGTNTVFDLLYKLNGKLVCIGCDLNRITFTHYVEQKCAVSYRYFKKFNGFLVKGNKTKIKVSTNYFVRKKNITKGLSLDEFEQNALNQNILLNVPFGRFSMSSILAVKFNNLAIKMLTKNEKSLIKQK